MPRTKAQWASETYSGDPVLVFGWRPAQRRLAAARVALDASALGSLTEICGEAQAALAELDQVPYSPYAQPEEGEEYLQLDLHEAPSAVGPDPDEQSLGDLLELLSDVAGLDEISANEAGDGQYVFYAIERTTVEGENVSFVKAINPTRILGRARWFYNRGDTLVATSRPDIALAGDADLVVTNDEILILNRNAFNRLFADTSYAADGVPDSVAALLGGLPPGLEVSDAAADALAAECRRLPSLAKRLNRLSGKADLLAQVTPSNLRAALRRNGEPEDRFIDAADALTLTPSEVRPFLDCIEGRWWISDFEEEPRRADRFRPRG